MKDVEGNFTAEVQLVAWGYEECESIFEKVPQQVLQKHSELLYL